MQTTRNSKEAIARAKNNKAHSWEHRKLIMQNNKEWRSKTENRKPKFAKALKWKD